MPLISIIFIATISLRAHAEDSCSNLYEAVVIETNKDGRLQNLDFPKKKYSLCDSSEVKDRIKAHLIERAKKSEDRAQLLLIEIYRLTGDSARAVKWSRVLANRQHTFMIKYLESFYAEVFKGEIESTEEMIDLAKKEMSPLRSASDENSKNRSLLYSEDLLYEALRRAKLDNDAETEIAAYMNLGNINLYNNDSKLNEEYGGYGFSFNKAKQFYEKALTLSKKNEDVAQEASARMAILVYLQKSQGVNEMCKHLDNFLAFYKEHEAFIDINPYPIGRITTNYIQTCSEQ